MPGTSCQWEIPACIDQTSCVGWISTPSALEDIYEKPNYNPKIVFELHNSDV